jgi:hypothetical protein
VEGGDGGAILTDLQRYVGGTLATPAYLQKTVQQGAPTTVFAAVSPLLEGIGGRYLNENTEASVVDERLMDPAALVNTLALYALSPENADRL